MNSPPPATATTPSETSTDSREEQEAHSAIRRAASAEIAPVASPQPECELAVLPLAAGDGQVSATAERMRRARERRREGVRWVLSVEITQDRIDEWVSRGDLSEEDGENKQAVAEFVEWLISSGDAEGRLSAPPDPVAADAAFAAAMGGRSFGCHPIKPSVALPVVFGPGDEHNLSPRQRAVFVADERPGNRTLAANDTSRNWWPLRVTEQRNDYEIIALLQSVSSAGQRSEEHQLRPCDS